jgi:hypothetical protein
MFVYILCLFLGILVDRFVDFEQHFKDIFKKHSPHVRPFYLHITSVVVRLSLICFLKDSQKELIRMYKRRGRHSE